MHQETTVTPEQSEISSETSDNLNSISLNTEALQNLPVFDQDYVGAMSRFLDPGGMGTGGVTLIVDGVEANGVAVSASAIKRSRSIRILIRLSFHARTGPHRSGNQAGNQ